MLLRLAIPLTVIVATSAYAMRPLPDTIPYGQVIVIPPEPTSEPAHDIRGLFGVPRLHAHPNWERIGAHWRNTFPANAGPTVPWGPLVCDKPWCGKNATGFGWWNRDIAAPYNKNWAEAKRQIKEARTR